MKRETARELIAPVAVGPENSTCSSLFVVGSLECLSSGLKAERSEITPMSNISHG